MDTGGGSENGKVHVGNNGLSWDIWSVGNWGTSSPSPLSPTPSTFHNNHHQTVPFSTIHQHHYTHRDFCGGGRDGHGAEPHHHLTCLKLGKRQYYEEEQEGTKKERIVLLGSSSSSASAPVPRCQVEGCNVALADAKDYHRRHKVCGLHSKAPKVVVHGLEQRFCQQCSRFHVTSEFDDAKRSCRRRLAGHNERRRKSSSDSIMRNPSHGRALSLLSAEASRWVSSDFSYRSSAALRELIAENRAALLGRQLLFDRSSHTTSIEDHVSVSPLLHQQHLPLGAPVNLPEGWHDFHEANPHVTLDLMQVPGSSLEFLPGRSESKEEEECCEIWKSLEETHVA